MICATRIWLKPWPRRAWYVAGCQRHRARPLAFASRAPDARKADVGGGPALVPHAAVMSQPTHWQRLALGARCGLWAWDSQADGCGARQENPLWNRHEIMSVPNRAHWRQLLWQHSEEG